MEKIYCLIIAIILLGGLLVFKMQDPRRPLFLLLFFSIILLSQNMFSGDFFPFSRFAEWGTSKSEAAHYYKLDLQFAGGSKRKAHPKEIISDLSVRKSRAEFQDLFAHSEKNADISARFLAEKYRWRDPARNLTGIVFEEWEWNFLHVPQDANRGFVKRRIPVDLKTGAAHV